MGMEWGETWPPAPAQMKVAAGGRVALKLLLSLFLAGLALRLLVDRSAYFLPPTAAPEEAALVVTAPAWETGGRLPPNETDDTFVVVSALLSLAAPGKKEDSQEDKEDAVVSASASIPQTDPDTKEDSQEERCDLFHGEWVSDLSAPAYTNASCRFIESPQNCMTNGRPDNDYLYWRWKPYGCDIPPFDGKKFLEGNRGKHWALIGDSILRNHVQSLLCLLAKVEDPTEVYHDKTFKSRIWHFPSHNFTLSLVWSPFLIKAEIFEDDDGVSSSEPQLHFGILDTNWTRQWNSFDYVVISTGQWFFKTAVYWENGSVIGCHYCQNKNLTDIASEYSFRKSLREAFRFITSSPHKPVVFYRTWTPSHFENGEWFSGGTCNRTVPFKPGEAGDRESDTRMWRIEGEEFAKAVADDGPSNAGRLKLLDTFELSLLRPDGHPGPYRTYHPFGKGGAAKVQNDCLHWCLPGPIDAWNDVIMQMSAKDDVGEGLKRPRAQASMI